jgi:hypothetical protein
MIFKDDGGTTLPDGEVFYSGTLEFVAKSARRMG